MASKNVLGISDFMPFFLHKKHDMAKFLQVSYLYITNDVWKIFYHPFSFSIFLTISLSCFLINFFNVSYLFSLSYLFFNQNFELVLISVLTQET
jgi:hypothetical protein